MAEATTLVRLDPVAFDGLEADVQALLSGWSVQAGEAVQAGQEIGIAELVKASVPVLAPHAGRVLMLCVAAGENFERDAVLARIG
jgi:biotin carboxyl carrier protein